MVAAKEGRVMVNARKSTPDAESVFRAHPIGTPVFLPPPEPDNEYGIEPGEMELAKPAPGDQGPCLYFGPRGERCGRRAVRDGFCTAHLPGATAFATAKSTTRSKKVLAVLIAISGLLWPLLADIVREVLRWLHSH